MKKRKLLFLSVLFLLIATVFLSSCIVSNTNRAKKIPVYGNYRLVGGTTATQGKKRVAFIDFINPAIKREGYKIISSSWMGMHMKFSGNNGFFNYKFYYENTAEATEDYTVYYCFGYMDLVTLTPNIFRFAKAEHVKHYSYSNGAIIEKFENLIIYSADSRFFERSFEIVNADTLDRVSVDVEVAEDYTLCYASGDMLLFKHGTEENYFAVNYTTGERDEDKIPALVEKLNAESHVEYDGKNYSVDIAEETVTFTECDSDNGFTVTIDRLRESSEEFRKVEQIFDCELTFNNALVQNGEIYLSARYYNEDLFFGMGMSSKSSTVACFLYEPEASTFKYIGWLSANTSLDSVIKL